MVKATHKMSHSELIGEIYLISISCIKTVSGNRGRRGRYIKKLKMSLNTRSAHRREQNRIAQRNRRERIKVTQETIKQIVKMIEENIDNIDNMENTETDTSQSK